MDIDAAGTSAGVYVAPTIDRLGTLAELTLGSSGGLDDAVIGGAGGFGDSSVDIG